jgi:hypothetical protein
VADTEDPLARLQAIMTELLKQRISESLARVESALGAWRAEETGEFEAHAEVLRHAARTEKLAARMARVGLDRAGSYLRDSFDLGLIDRAEFKQLIGCEPEEIDPSPGLEDDDERSGLVRETGEERDVAERHHGIRRGLEMEETCVFPDGPFDALGVRGIHEGELDTVPRQDLGEVTVRPAVGQVRADDVISRFDER